MVKDITYVKQNAVHSTKDVIYYFIEASEKSDSIVTEEMTNIVDALIDFAEKEITLKKYNVVVNDSAAKMYTAIADFNQIPVPNQERFMTFHEDVIKYYIELYNALTSTITKESSVLEVQLGLLKLQKEDNIINSRFDILKLVSQYDFELHSTEMSKIEANDENKKNYITSYEQIITDIIIDYGDLATILLSDRSQDEKESTMLAGLFAMHKKIGKLFLLDTPDEQRFINFHQHNVQFWSEIDQLLCQIALSGKSEYSEKMNNIFDQKYDDLHKEFIEFIQQENNNKITSVPFF